MCGSMLGPAPVDGVEDAAPWEAAPPPVPSPRGPLTAWLASVLRAEPGWRGGPVRPGVEGTGPEDAALALYCLYELHYRGFEGVDERHEWNPALLALRADLERTFEARLLDEVGPVGAGVDAVSELRRLAGDTTGPSLSRFVAERGTLEHLREFAVHRSAYQLKEADPHTWAIPRLAGRAKAALVSIQHGEYGDGTAAAAHATLFAATMQALDLDASYGAYVDRLPATTLETVNLVSLFGLHRRWRGALVGHLALFEMTSVGPMSRYAAALRRLGVAGSAAAFYDAHVVADAAHERIALDEMVAGLLALEPHLAGQVVFGARAVSHLEARFAGRLLDAWSDGRSSLRPPP